MKYAPYLKLASFFVALLPLTRLVYGALTDGLGANPIEYITRDLGTWGLTFLLITLSVTPLRLLTATSTNAMVKRLGAKQWLFLHRLVYIIGIGGVLHYWWLVKRDITQPLIYAAILAGLLGFRVVHRYANETANKLDSHAPAPQRA